MSKITRREAIGGILATGASVLSFNGANAAQADAAMAFRGLHQPKPLPFDAAKLRGISEKVIKSHWKIIISVR